MKHTRLMGLVPSIILALGMLASTLVMVIDATSGWLVAAGLLVLALAMLGATVLDHRLHGALPGRLRPALLACVVILLAFVILALRDPSRVATLMPILGAVAVIPLLTSGTQRDRDRRRACRNRRSQGGQGA